MVRTRSSRTPNRHPHSLYSHSSPNRENRNLASPTSGRPRLPATRHAARARSSVCRARPDIEIRPDIARTTSPTACRTRIFGPDRENLNFATPAGDLSRRVVARHAARARSAVRRARANVGVAQSCTHATSTGVGKLGFSRGGAGRGSGVGSGQNHDPWLVWSHLACRTRRST